MTKIFPNEQSQNVSTYIEIQEQGVIIQARGMSEGQTFLVEYNFQSECSEVWEPVRWCCGQTKLSYPTNQLILPPVSGRYRLVAINDDQEIGFDVAEWENVEVQFNRLSNVPLNDFITVCC